jgi:hypothetical protein
MSDTRKGQDVERPIPVSVFDLTDHYGFAECVEPDGTTSLWLLSDIAEQDARGFVELPEHEDEGRLPAAFRRRLEGRR